MLYNRDITYRKEFAFMFDGLRRIFKPDKPKKIPFSYGRVKGDVIFYFFSDNEMEEAQLTTAMDIICDNASKGINGQVTAKEVWKKCFPALKAGAVHIESHDEGKHWEVTVSENTLAFQ